MLYAEYSIGLRTASWVPQCCWQNDQGQSHFGSASTSRLHSHDEGSDGCAQQSISAMKYEPKGDRSVQMERHATIETEDENRQEEDWKDNVEIKKSHEHPKPQVVHLFSYFTDMWDGNLVTTSTVKYRIELDPPEAKMFIAHLTRPSPPHVNWKNLKSTKRCGWEWLSLLKRSERRR